MDEIPEHASTHPQSSPIMDSEHHNTLMAVLAYLGPLVIVSYLVAAKDPFVKFHIRQGLVLLVIEIVIWVVLNMFIFQLWMLWPIIQLLNLGTLILSIVGIVHAIQGKQQELPLIGHYAKHFTI